MLRTGLSNSGPAGPVTGRDIQTADVKHAPLPSASARLDCARAQPSTGGQRWRGEEPVSRRRGDRRIRAQPSVLRHNAIPLRTLPGRQAGPRRGSAGCVDRGEASRSPLTPRRASQNTIWSDPKCEIANPSAAAGYSRSLNLRPPKPLLLLLIYPAFVLPQVTKQHRIYQ